jgi:hypothetical protein
MGGDAERTGRAAPGDKKARGTPDEKKNTVIVPTVFDTVVRVSEAGMPPALAGLGLTTRVTVTGRKPEMTDARGEVLFRKLPAGPCFVQAERPGFKPVSVTRNIPMPGNVIPIHMERICHVDAAWVDTTGRCGDLVDLKATLSPPPPAGTSAKIEVFVEGASASGAAEGLVLFTDVQSGGKLLAAWPAMAASSRWRTDSMRFRVTADVGQSRYEGVSANVFRFKDRPTTGRLSQKRSLRSTIGTVEMNHDATLDPNEVLCELRIVLDPTTEENTPATDDHGKKIVQVIEDVWNGNFRELCFHRKGCGRGHECKCTFDCCKVSWRIRVKYLGIGNAFLGHHIWVKIEKPGSTSACSGATGLSVGVWQVSDKPPFSVAHEAGHLLGQFDEYVSKAANNDPSGEQKLPPKANNVMVSSWCHDLQPLHYRWSLEFLNSKTGGDEYETIKNNA